MDAVRVLAVYIGVWTVQAESVIQQLYQFKINAQLDGKMCNDSDVAFQGTPLSLVNCAGRCRTSAGCSGFMYNRVKSSCVGCRGQYTTGTTLDAELGTQYFEGNWWTFNGIFYKLAAERMRNSDAVDYCELHGGILVRIDSDDKRKFLANALSTYGIYHWIGITDKGSEGTWKWLDDRTRINYTNWNVDNGMPDGFGNCAKGNPNFGYQWEDIPCTNRNHVICERAWTG